MIAPSILSAMMVDSSLTHIFEGWPVRVHIQLSLAASTLKPRPCLPRAYLQSFCLVEEALTSASPTSESPPLWVPLHQAVQDLFSRQGHAWLGIRTFRSTVIHGTQGWGGMILDGLLRRLAYLGNRADSHGCHAYKSHPAAQNLPLLN
jgi:hypothetical protein